VDHYALDHRWEKSVLISCKKIMVIDDLADRLHVCDVLLDQNYYTDMLSRYTNKVQDNCQLLLGPSYALLKDDFKFFRTQIAPHSGEVKKILVFFGGVDAADYTSLTINALAEINCKWSVDVVIGLQHPNAEQIQKTCEKFGFNCHVQTARMAELMSEADLSIGAGGTAIWERCCLGLPAIVFCTAENQRVQVADAFKLGLLYAPEIDGLNFKTELRKHLDSLIESPSTLQSISESCKQHVNGRGAQKVAHHLLGEFIEIRRVEDSDSISIFQWRNDENIRNVSKSSEIISISVHQKWFENVLRLSLIHI
jgi:UDP-2,4-diacetamido-2,4,6-trideoxy-beta-L-altropyranose hydrolase